MLKCVVCYPHNVGHGMEIQSLVESCLQTKEEGWKEVKMVSVAAVTTTLDPESCALLSNRWRSTCAAFALA